MLLDQAVINVVFVLQMVSAIKENNISSSNDHLKNKYGCLPIEKWTLMPFNFSSVEIICISKDYKAYIEPKEIALTPISMDIQDRTIVNIDEKEKTMTIEIRMSYTWADERIKIVFYNKVGVILLPPSTTKEKPDIWTPFQHLEILSLKERKYILDPIISKNRLMVIKQPFTSLVWSQISWRVTVSCPYDFSSFPFDEQNCSLTMILPFGWNLTVPTNKNHSLKYVKDGFEIETQPLDSFRIDADNLDWHSLYFGIKATFKRKLSKYIFQYYLPSITIVIASSVSFIIPLSAIPGRVALMGTQFLTLTKIFINEMVHT